MSQKRAKFGSCSLVNHGEMFMIFSVQNQHTLGTGVRTMISLCVHFCCLLQLRLGLLHSLLSFDWCTLVIKTNYTILSCMTAFYSVLITRMLCMCNIYCHSVHRWCIFWNYCVVSECLLLSFLLLLVLLLLLVFCMLSLHGEASLLVSINIE